MDTELREREGLYRSLVEASSDLIWAVDVEGRSTFVDRAAAEMLGYEPAELIGVPFTDLQPPDVVVGITGTARDVTAQRRAAAELHKRETLRDDYQERSTGAPVRSRPRCTTGSIGSSSRRWPTIKETSWPAW